MNLAYKHLNAKERIGELTVGQWAVVFGGMIVMLLWGFYLSPLSRYLSIVTAVYLGGLPVALALVASYAEFNVWRFAASAWRWTLAAGRYAAGAGAPTPGYRIVPDPRGTATGDASRNPADRSARRYGVERAGQHGVIAPARLRSAALRQTGELLGVEAIDRSGLVITSEGAFVRYLQVIPPNPLILSREDQATTASAYCQCLSRLRPGQCVQFYVDARPTDLRSILERSRREVEQCAGRAARARRS